MSKSKFACFQKKSRKSDFSKMRGFAEKIETAKFLLVQELSEKESRSFAAIQIEKQGGRQAATT